MKLAILTQPLLLNYGGILQAFALQSMVKKLGHDVRTVLISEPRQGLIWDMGRYLKRFVFKIMQRPFLYSPTQKELSFIGQNTRNFIKENIALTEPLGIDQLSRLLDHGYDGFIVGSDQVWRLDYSRNITSFFLDFIEKDGNTLKIAYAASFGVDSWKYPSDLTQACSKLAKTFNAISVRESSAVDLCKSFLDVEAKQVLDPVLLLSIEDLQALISKDSTVEPSGGLVTYILDNSEWSRSVVSKIACLLNLTPYSVYPSKPFYEAGPKSLEQCVLPPLGQWLRGFRDASFIVTDSFHGTVLSMLFNKPFVTIGNANRGNSRFDSLLDLFGLKTRQLNDFESIERVLCERIDYSRVAHTLEEEKQKSISFLANALNKDK